MNSCVKSFGSIISQSRGLAIGPQWMGPRSRVSTLLVLSLGESVSFPWIRRGGERLSFFSPRHNWKPWLPRHCLPVSLSCLHWLSQVAKASSWCKRLRDHQPLHTNSVLVNDSSCSHWIRLGWDQLGRKKRMQWIHRCSELRAPAEVACLSTGINSSSVRFNTVDWC